jgi:hypothetical protein
MNTTSDKQSYDKYQSAVIIAANRIKDDQFLHHLTALNQPQTECRMKCEDDKDNNE